MPDREREAARLRTTAWLWTCVLAAGESDRSALHSQLDEADQAGALQAAAAALAEYQASLLKQAYGEAWADAIREQLSILEIDMISATGQALDDLGSLGWTLTCVLAAGEADHALVAAHLEQAGEAGALTESAAGLAQNAAAALRLIYGDDWSTKLRGELLGVEARLLELPTDPTSDH